MRDRFSTKTVVRVALLLTTAWLIPGSARQAKADPDGDFPDFQWAGDQGTNLYQGYVDAIYAFIP